MVLCPIPFKIFINLLKYSWLAMLCYFLLYSKVSHLYIFFFILFSIMVYLRILNIVPCAKQEDLVVHLT